jgi:hypothetical protein
LLHGANSCASGRFSREATHNRDPFTGFSVRHCRSTVKTEFRSTSLGCPLASVLGTSRCLAGGRAPPHRRARRRRSLCGLRPSSGLRRSPFPRRLARGRWGNCSGPSRAWSGDRDARSSAGRNSAGDLALGEKSGGYGGLRPHQARCAPNGATRRKRTAPQSLRRCLTRASLRRDGKSWRGRGTARRALAAGAASGSELSPP